VTTPTPPAPKRKRSHKAKAYKKSGVFATPASLNTSGKTRDSVIQAAQVFGDQARKNAARFSQRIPLATYVDGYTEEAAQVITDGVLAPNAAPFEFGLRHPLWGNRNDWYKQPTRAYMNSAARNPGAISRAADAYAEAERNMLAEEYGYTE
jgi:hypothetical protein